MRPSDPGAAQTSLAALAALATCARCPLCQHQAPLLDGPGAATVLWVGLSAVAVDPGSHARPLGANTRTGEVVDRLEAQLLGVPCRRSNLVKCPPQQDDRLRVPNRREMDACWPNLAREIALVAPRVVVLLGRQVADYVRRAHGLRAGTLDPAFAYTSWPHAGVAYVSVHHPSFILVYRRSQMDAYLDGVSTAIRQQLI